MHDSRSRPRNPQGEGPRLRGDLIEAAGRLLEGGETIDSLSLRGVAREAGIAAPSVYLHFASKNALLHAVVEDHFARLQRAIERGSETAKNATSRLLAGCLAYCRYAVEQPGSYRILFNSPRSGSEVSGFGGSKGEAAFRVLVNAVAACIATGEARAGDPFRMATDIWAALHGVASLRRASPGFPWPPLEDQVRGILEAFTGIPYRTEAAMEEPDGGGSA